MICDEIQSLGDTIRLLYKEMTTLHKAVVLFHDMQKRSWKNMKLLKVIHVTINTIQEWGTKYLNAPSELARKRTQ